MRVEKRPRAGKSDVLKAIFHASYPKEEQDSVPRQGISASLPKNERLMEIMLETKMMTRRRKKKEVVGWAKEKMWGRVMGGKRSSDATSLTAKTKSSNSAD